MHGYGKSIHQNIKPNVIICLPSGSLLLFIVHEPDPQIGTILGE